MQVSIHIHTHNNVVIDLLRINEFDIGFFKYIAFNLFVYLYVSL